VITEPVPGLWRWTARHPEWHPGDWGSAVASFAVDAGDAALLIDPLIPAEDAETFSRGSTRSPTAPWRS
jgi:hypothetical protein